MSEQQQAKVPMICAHCGAVMNPHAIKIDYSVPDSSGDSVFGGALEEVHTCPQCGRIQLRQA
jgi:predicted RNA-binding Zn-ribbon protein involved in translation (DUF1610 family)